MTIQGKVCLIILNVAIRVDIVTSMSSLGDNFYIGRTANPETLPVGADKSSDYLTTRKKASVVRMFP